MLTLSGGATTVGIPEAGSETGDARRDGGGDG
jgi:hypothetical protein